MTNVAGSSTSRRYILEDGTVYDEPESSMTPAEMKQFWEDWGTPLTVTLRGMYEGELASARGTALSWYMTICLGTASPSRCLNAYSICLACFS
ncbi:hypothetical protein ACLB2K_017266 [Fragaria x ananassa]